MAYEDISSLKRRSEALREPRYGIAQLLRDRKANKLDEQITQAEQRNQQNQQRELAMLLRGQKTGRVGDSYVARAADEFVPSDPALREITAKMLMERATGSNKPSNVQEWEYFSRLPQDQQEQYLTMRRGTNPINLGDQFVIPSSVNPAGAPRASFDVGLRPGELPSVQGAQTAAVEQAKIDAIPQRSSAELQAELGAAAATRQQTRSIDANSTLDLLDVAEPLLDVSTGSGLGAMRDIALGIVGQSTEGAEAAAQLKTIAGQLIMRMPRMEGPQSDKDTQLYREMAGQIGDPSVPNEIRKAALRTIRELNLKYAAPQGAPASGGTQRFIFNPLTGELE